MENNMSQNLTISPEKAGALERVLIRGDLSRLNEEERIYYYKAVCESVGLNPLTQPFSYLVLKGKTVLYANKCATDQLRANHKISILKLETKTEAGIFEATAYASNAEGRLDTDMGAVSIANLRGEDLANAKLKAVTKAKRRVTLSMCGLGMLDETEIESITTADRQREAVQDYISAAPAAQRPIEQEPKTVAIAPPKRNVRADNIAAIGELIKSLQARGIGLDTIQTRMYNLTGCSKRAELNGGQAVVVIEELAEWLQVLDEEGEPVPSGEEGADESQN
jgi:hypothetical protein